MKCIIGLQPLLFSCLNTPLLLLLISPSAFAWSDLYLHNTQSEYFIWWFTSTRSKTIFKHVPQLLRSYWVLVPFPLFMLVFWITSPAHKVLYYTPPPQQCCWWGTSPLQWSMENEQMCFILHQIRWMASFSKNLPYDPRRRKQHCLLRPLCLMPSLFAARSLPSPS